MQDYHKLLVYKKTLVFVTLVYRLSKLYPKEEVYGLKSQLCRAVISILANIAEGSGKPTKKDFLKFLHISLGSLNECQCYFEVSLELKYINQEQYDYINNKRNEVGYLLTQFIASIKLSTK
jgi:four helix bundle protein